MVHTSTMLKAVIGFPLLCWSGASVLALCAVLQLQVLWNPTTSFCAQLFQHQHTAVLVLGGDPRIIRKAIVGSANAGYYVAKQATKFTKGPAGAGQVRSV